MTEQDPTKRQLSAQLEAPQLAEMVQLLKRIDSKLGFFQAILVIYIIIAILGFFLNLITNI